MFEFLNKKRAAKAIKKKYGSQVSIVIPHAGGYVVDSINGELGFFLKSEIKQMLRGR